VFALRSVLGVRSAARTDDSRCWLAEEDWEAALLKAALDAPSKSLLKKTFDLDAFAKDEDEPQKEHADLLQGVREGRINMPEPTKCAAWLLVQNDLKPYTRQCKKLVVALDAAYRFSCALGKMAQNGRYDFRARGHASDWGDVLQLHYLCDGSMHFLTFDSDFRNRTKGSPQSSRILQYPEFVRSLDGR